MKQFDPYRQWLGIPPEEQPPHLYRLLGIGLFEDDIDVIEGAADRQMAHVQRHQTGPHAAQSQKLLSELTTARLCLLREDRKALYDRQLRQKLAASAAASAVKLTPPPAPSAMSDPAEPVATPLREPPRPEPITAAPDSIDSADVAPAPAGSHHSPRRSISTTTLALGGGMAAAVVLALVGMLLSRGGEPSKLVQESSTPSSADDRDANDDAQVPARVKPKHLAMIDKKLAPMEPEGETMPDPISEPAGETPETSTDLPTAETLASEPTEPTADTSASSAAAPPPAPAETAPAPAPPAQPAPAAVGTSGLELSRHRMPIRAIAVSPDGKLMISAAATYAPDELDAHRFWDFQKGADVTAGRGYHKSGANALAISLDGEHWLEANQPGHLNVRGIKIPGGTWHYRDGPPLYCIAVTSDGQWAAAGGRDGVLLSSRNISGEQRMFHWASPSKASVSAVALSGAGTRMWVGCGGTWNDNNQPEAGGDHALRLFDGPAWKVVALAGHQGCIWGMSAVPDASRVVTASEDRTLRVWDLKRLKSPRVLTGHEGPVYAVAISADGRLIASGGADRTVRIWNADSGTELHRFTGHTDTIRAIALSPDGHFAFSGGNDLIVRGWDLQSISGSSLPKVGASNSGQRLPIPADEAIAGATSAVLEIFGDDITQAKKSADKVALAERLLAQSASGQDGTEQYALLAEARRLALAAGAPAIVVRVIEQTGARFEVDVPNETARCLEQLLRDKENLSAAARKELADALAPLAEEALARNDYTSARRLLAVSTQSLRKAGDPMLARQFAQRLAAAEDQEKAYAAYQKASDKLTGAGGNDPDAQLVVGNYLCFVKQDWQQGLPHLVAGSDPALQEAAALELKSPAGTDEQIKLGDLWFSLFEGAKGKGATQYGERADKWYQSAISTAQGLTRARLVKRIEELSGTRTKSGPDVANAARPSKSNDRSLANALKAAVSENRLLRSEVHGKAVGVPFYDVPPAGWLLAGLNVTVRNKSVEINGRVTAAPGIASVQPVYWNGKSAVNGEVYGKPSGSMTSLVAKKGYAVRILGVSFDPVAVLGVDLNYARIGPAGLEESDSYTSDHIGGSGNAGSFYQKTFPPVVGICGTVNPAGVSGLGLVYVNNE